ncbi:MAG: hypothetical protein O7B79_12485, partial [SAR324 cluster bacterium]|nr:hypothetical protein [SAR324 cluster bacterium]
MAMTDWQSAALNLAVISAVDFIGGIREVEKSGFGVPTDCLWWRGGLFREAGIAQEGNVPFPLFPIFIGCHKIV